jgi:endoglucanase
LPPAQVTNLTITSQTSYQINLVWTPNSEADFDHYNIYKSIYPNFVVTTSTKPVQNTSYNSYSDNEVVGSMTYYYKVSAVNKSGIMGPLSTEEGQKTPVEGFLIWTTITCVSLLVLVGALSALWPVSSQEFLLTLGIS